MPEAKHRRGVTSGRWQGWRQGQPSAPVKTKLLPIAKERMAAKYPGTCDRCGRAVRPPELIVFLPRTKTRKKAKVIHDKCAAGGS